MASSRSPQRDAAPWGDAAQWSTLQRLVKEREAKATRIRKICARTLDLREQDEVAGPRHLIVLAHGLMGGTSDLSFLRDSILEADPQDTHVLLSATNQDKTTVSRMHAPLKLYHAVHPLRYTSTSTLLARDAPAAPCRKRAQLTPSERDRTGLPSEARAWQARFSIRLRQCLLLRTSRCWATVWEVGSSWCLSSWPEIARAHSASKDARALRCAFCATCEREWQDRLACALMADTWAWGRAVLALRGCRSLHTPSSFRRPTPKSRTHLRPETAQVRDHGLSALGCAALYVCASAGSSTPPLHALCWPHGRRPLSGRRQPGAQSGPLRSELVCRLRRFAARPPSMLAPPAYYPRASLRTPPPPCLPPPCLLSAPHLGF